MEDFTVKIEKNNHVRVYDCCNWGEFISKVRLPEPALASTKAIYRGHANTDWLLMSHLDWNLSLSVRKDDGSSEIHSHPRMAQLPAGYYRKICNEILQRFRRNVRTLDWTESPYVAAFFAFADIYHQFEPRSARHFPTWRSTEKVRVWGLRQLEPELERKDEFEIVRDLPPAALRQKAQSGVFTVLWSHHADLETYLKARGMAHCLEYYDIPIANALEALRDLQLMNVTPAVLFPDLHGAALQANINTDSIPELIAQFENTRKELGE